MDHIWACTCGHEAECTREDQRIGAVYECQGCQTVWANVRPRRGGQAWVAIDEADVLFHCLLDEPEAA